MADTTSSAGAATSTAAFNPYNQDFVLYMPDGVTGVVVNLSSVMTLQHTAVSTAIVYSAQIGVCGLMLLVLLLMTKPEKRRSIVFALNLAAVLLVLIRGIIMCLELNDAFLNFYNWTMSYYPDDQLVTARRHSMAAEVLGFLVIVAIELSLMFQTKTVCATIRQRAINLAIYISCIFVAASVIAIRFVAVVFNTMWSILNTEQVTDHQWDLVNTITRVDNGLMIGSIVFFSIIFCAKLGHAIMKRRSLGLKQFGPIQIIFVMGCQTCVIPAFFGIMSYWVYGSSQMYSLMTCVVAVFLPLSSIWASTNTTGGNSKIAAPIQWHAKSTTSNMDSEKNLLPTSTANTATLVGDAERGVSLASTNVNPRRIGHHASASHDSVDLEFAKMGHRIQVDRTYSIRSE